MHAFSKTTLFLAMVALLLGACGDDTGSNRDAGTDTPDTYCDQHPCWSVPPTKLTACYNATGVLAPCAGDVGSPECVTTPFCGQDAQYPETARSFTQEDLPSGLTVHDDLTDLEWQDSYEVDLNWAAALAHCESEDYGGHQDWRLPTYHELADIADYSTHAPAIDTTAFPSGASGWDFWTASPVADEPDEAWAVYYWSGSPKPAAKSSEYNVRCVRGDIRAANGAERFVVSGEGGNQIAVDEATGLTWEMDHRNGLDWEAALSFCENLSTANFTDWKLPDITELRSLIDISLAPIGTGFPGTVSSFYYVSSTTASSTNTTVFYMDLNGAGQAGYQAGTTKTTTSGWVRCVR